MASVGPQDHRGGKGSGDYSDSQLGAGAGGSPAPGSGGYFRWLRADKLQNFRWGRTPGGSPHTPEGNRALGQTASERDRPNPFCIGLRERLPPIPKMAANGSARRGNFAVWDRRSLGGGGASSPPGLEDARPAGVLPHLRRCARAFRARKSLKGTLELIAHPPELPAIALCSPEVGGR